MEQISQLSSVHEEVQQEVSPITPKINKLGGYSSASSPFSSYYSTENTPINSPRRIRRHRHPVPFNILVIGFLGSGKTSFLDFLYGQLNKTKEQKHLDLDEREKSNNQLEQGFTSCYVDTEVNGERVGVTLWDSRGLGMSRDDEIIDLQMDEVVMFLESKFEDTFSEETKVKRSHKHMDTHIHCVLYLIDPTSPFFHYDVSVDSVDISIIQKLSKYTTVIPVISKVDTCTNHCIANIKVKLRKGMEENGIKFLEFLRNNESHDELSTNGSIHNNHQEDNYDDTLDILPFTCMSPDQIQKNPFSIEKTGALKLCREYPWGVANPLDEKHCDFLKLKEMIFSEWRNDMREFCKEVLYENWRTDRLQKLGDISLKMMKSEI